MKTLEDIPEEKRWPTIPRPRGPQTLAEVDIAHRRGSITDERAAVLRERLKA
jgi:hypothetical protein